MTKESLIKCFDGDYEEIKNNYGRLIRQTWVFDLIKMILNNTDDMFEYDDIIECSYEVAKWILDDAYYSVIIDVEKLFKDLKDIEIKSIELGAKNMGRDDNYNLYVEVANYIKECEDYSNSYVNILSFCFHKVA